jgi:FkbM family methyltransferase
MNFLNTLSFVWRHQLNRGGRVLAIGRLMRWQIASRVLPGPIALPFVEDTRLFVSRGMTGATGNWYCGLHEAEEMGFILHVLNSEDLFVDVGANIGSYTIMVAGAIGARVISVEPIPATFSSLERNVLLNGLVGLVVLHSIGLSSKRSEVLFTSDQDTVNHVLADGETGPSVRVPVVTMDEMLAGRVPAAIKIDVEGHELAVLEGARETISNPGVLAVLLEVNGSGARYGYSDEVLLAMMHGHGFAPYSYDPLARRLRDWDSSSDNVIFVRDRQEVDSRLMRAKRYRLVNGSI